MDYQGLFGKFQNHFNKILKELLTLVFLVGWLPPPNGFSPIAPKRKTKYSGHLSNLFYIICGHFDEKKIRGTPEHRGRVSLQSQRVEEDGCHLKIFQVAILKNICMILPKNLQNTISLLYKQKPLWNSAMFSYVIVTSYVDRFSWFWYQWNKKTDPTPYYVTKQPHFGRVSLKITGVVTTPLGRCVTKKAQEDEG